jgi:hypothetical protein
MDATEDIWLASPLRRHLMRSLDGKSYCGKYWAAWLGPASPGMTACKVCVRCKRAWYPDWELEGP